MEIVLLEDVKALGKKGQVVKVNDGYARNFILPKKLGVEATSKNLNDLKLQKANDAKIAAEQLVHPGVPPAVPSGGAGRLPAGPDPAPPAAADRAGYPRPGHGHDDVRGGRPHETSICPLRHGADAGHGPSRPGCRRGNGGGVLSHLHHPQRGWG